MREAHFVVTVHYESGVYMIKAVDRQFESYNFISNNLSAIVTRQFKISRDLKKLNVKAYFVYEN